MKQKSMVLLAVAGACGLVAMIGVQQLMSNKSASAKEETLVTVLVAKTEIPPRTPLDKENCEFKEMPEDTVPGDAITDLAQTDGLAVKTRLFPGSVVTSTMLGEETRATVDIPKGMRVLTVAVNLTKSHSGLITPGDYVDLQVTYQSRTDDRGLTTKSKTFMQNVEVFALDSVRASETTGAEEIKAKNISLLVTPTQANLLKLAEKTGELHLVLRGEGDLETSDVPDVDLAFLEEMTAGDTPTKAEEQAIAEGEEDVRRFLDDIGQEPIPQRAVEPAPAPEQVAVVDEPEHEVWELEIRAGEDVLTEEILIPVEKVAPELLEGAGLGEALQSFTSGEPSAQPSTVESASKGLLTVVKNVLNGAAERESNADAEPEAATSPVPDSNDATESNDNEPAETSGTKNETNDRSNLLDTIRQRESETKLRPTPEPVAPADAGLSGPSLLLGS